VPAGARFCPSCGQSLHAPGDERRVVTVLFGDIVGFTGLSETRDPEQVKNLVDRCFARLAADIREFGGTLDKVVGDALVALFGAPVAHEDDAERAVRAALQMQRTLDDLAGSLDVEVRMRIGVNTGEVLVGALRAGGDYTAMGDVVNTASRLQTLAQPGTVVVGSETHAATLNVFRYEPLGLLQARGREEGVEAWTAVEAVVQPGHRPPRRVSSRLVGRELESELLERSMVAAFEARRPTLVVLFGEAGVGKSRLGEDVVLQVLGTHRARVLSGRAVPYGAANAWWPIAEVMRMAIGVGPEDGADDARVKCVRAVADVVDGDAEEIERIVDALMYLVGIGTSLVEVDSKRAQDEVARAVRTFIEGLAAVQPLIVTIGDVQWADASVLFGLDDLLDRMHRVPIVVLLTARPEIESGWRPSGGHKNLVVLNLDPLSDEAAGELLTSLLGRDPGPRVRAELVERSGGNPLFVEELAALVRDDATVGALPATLRGIVAARLDALPAAERAVLDDAAVVGRRAPMTALLAVGGSRGGIAEAIEELVAKDLLVVEEGQCEFRSDLVREVVYGMLTKAERARRHAALAQWLESLEDTPNTDELLGELARHWSTAAELCIELGGVDGVPPDVRARAIEALFRAGERADDRELHAAANRVYDQLVRLVGDEPSADRRGALVGRARAATALRRDAEAAADLDVVEAEAREAGDDGRLARALTVRGDLLRNAGEYERSLEALEEARVLWQRVGDRRGEGSALRRIGWTKLFAGDLDAAEPILLEALDAFREAGALRGQAWAHQNLAWAAYGRSEPVLAEQRLHDSIELFRQIGDWGGLNWTTGMVGWVRFAQGDVVEAERHAEEALHEARSQGDTWQVGMMDVLLSSIRLHQGRTEDAVELGRAALQLFVELGDEWGGGQAAGPLVRALLATGRFEEAERMRVEAMARYGSTGEFPSRRVFSQLAAALSAVAVGQPERALAALADDDTRPGDHRFGATDLLVTRGTALLQLGKVSEAVELLAATVESAREAGPRAEAQAALALAYAADGRTADARRTAAEVLGGQRSYLDRVLAGMAEAAAAARDGDEPAAVAAIDRTTRIVESTQDRLSAAIVARARASVLEALGTPFAAGAAADAAERFAALGIEAPGWDRAIRLATGLNVPA
jgi:class 3 adenylate cyclase/tetratricopeptide (TPR) repeat protein